MLGEETVLGKEEVIDEVLVSIMKSPHSYTGDNIVEISTHGGSLVINTV